MTKKLRYPHDFQKIKAKKLDEKAIQKLVDDVVEGKARTVSCGDTVVSRSVDEEGVWETVEVYKLVARSKNIVEGLIFGHISGNKKVY